MIAISILNIKRATISLCMCCRDNVYNNNKSNVNVAYLHKDNISNVKPFVLTLQVQKFTIVTQMVIFTNSKAVLSS